jgi:hypothetical protein
MVSQLDAMRSAMDSIEHDLLVRAQESGEMQWETTRSKVRVAIKKTRRVNRQRLSDIVGEEVLRDFPSVNLGDLDAIRRDPRLTQAQRSMIETAIDSTFSEPSIKVTKKGIK